MLPQGYFLGKEIVLGWVATARLCKGCPGNKVCIGSRKRMSLYKDIGTLHLPFGAFSGILGTCFSALIHLELSCSELVI